jgi:hypothetical protein
VPKYNVNSPLKWNGKRYGIGSAVDMDEDTAAPLVEQGVIEDPNAKKAVAKAMHAAPQHAVGGAHQVVSQAGGLREP